MSRKETIISVFVASPSDVSDERQRLEAIIGEINATHSRRTGIRLESWRWERDASPSFSEDAQAVINDQSPQDCDIFIGIFWLTIGSPTKRAKSGTLEEFELAKERYDKDPETVRLMLYFKTAPPSSMNNLKIDQYQGVVEFKSRVKKDGAFFGEFHSTDDFANQVRIHLTKLVCDWPDAHRKNVLPDNTEENSVSELSGCGEDTSFTSDLDDGLLDLEEIFEEHIADLSAVLGRMNEAIADIGETTKERSEAIRSINVSDNGRNISVHERQKLRARVKPILKQVSKDMNQFVARMNQDLPLFRQHLDRGVDAFTRAVPIYLEINEDRSELKEVITSMIDAMEEMVTSMEGFRGSVHGLPRLTAALTRSKRQTEQVLQEVIDITMSGRASLNQVLSVIP